MDTGSPIQSLALAAGAGAAVVAVASRIGIPPILPLLVGGFFLGPAGLGLIDATTLGPGLVALVSVAIGVLVFEGGLQLDGPALRSAPKAVRGLLILGAAITGVLATLAARFILGLSWDVAAILGSMLIVTGPTVVQPILRRVPLKPGLDASLRAESILLDPVGVLLAVGTLELVIARVGAPEAVGPLGMALIYAKPVAVGLFFGAVAGLLARWLLERSYRLRPGDEATPVWIGLGACLIAIGVSEALAHEAGLVAATVGGLLMARAIPDALHPLKHLSEQISTLLIGTLFMLIASRFTFETLGRIGWAEILFVATLILLIRPACAFISLIGSSLNLRERSFVALLAPRGIVAASLASIVALELAQAVASAPDSANPSTITALAEQGAVLETITMLVIVLTVLIGGSLAGPAATLLGVRAGKPNGVLIIGAHQLARELALALTRLDIKVRLVDTNASNVALAGQQGLVAIRGNAMDPVWLEDQIGPTTFGWLLSLTDNEQVDRTIARWGSEQFGPGRAFTWLRRKPTDADPPVALPWGRPLRHLLFQFDIGVARIATIAPDSKNPQDEQSTDAQPPSQQGAVASDAARAPADAAPADRDRPKSDPHTPGFSPVAIVGPDGAVKLVPANHPLERVKPGSHIVGLRIGPAPTTARPASKRPDEPDAALAPSAQPGE